MKLRSPHPRGCLICLRDGSTLSIPNHADGTEVSTKFFARAIALGCEPVAEREETEPDSLAPATTTIRGAAIRAVRRREAGMVSYADRTEKRLQAILAGLDRGLTQKTIAEQLGITQQAVSALLKRIDKQGDGAVCAEPC